MKIVQIFIAFVVLLWSWIMPEKEPESLVLELPEISYEIVHEQ